MGIENRDTGRRARCEDCGKALAAGRRGPLPKRCRKCQSRHSNRQAVRARRDREDRMRRDIRAVGNRISNLAALLNAHAQGPREKLDECVAAAVPALREDWQTLLRWEVELARRRRRRRT